jgi:hypothetical protein
MVRVGMHVAGRRSNQIYGWVMRRVIVFSLAGFALSGCASFSLPGADIFSSTPAPVTLQLESMPSGAEARTSAGPSCRTPCSLSVPAEPLTVTYTMDKYQPQTVSVQPARRLATNPQTDIQFETYVTDLDPNPVFAQLEPSAPSKRAAKRPAPKRPAKRPPATTTGAAEPAPAASSPFPAPANSSPFPTR